MQFLQKLLKMLENIDILSLLSKLFGVKTKLSCCKAFHRKFIRNEKKTEIFMNKSVYLGLSILELSKILMYEFWYDLCKTKIW